MIELTEDQAIQVVNLILTLDHGDPVYVEEMQDVMHILKADEALMADLEE